jgi:threonine dehydratase
MAEPVSFADVEAAAERISGHVHRTPVLTSTTLDRELGASVFFKCENMQKVGAFKARGATNAVFSLTEEECARGVITHSSGNHGAAVAYAAAKRGAPCTVVMPEKGSPIKAAAVAGYGAKIERCAEGQRQAATDAIIATTGATFIHPFNDPRVIAGQGTAALELLQDVPNLDAVIAPVGGGGLMSGTTLTFAAMRPEAKIYGAEPTAVDDAFRSLRDGIRHPSVPNPNTICDGLLTGLGDLTYAILNTHGVEIICVDDQAVIQACRFHLERMKMLVEPSGATPLAALRTLGPRIQSLRIGAIITGGNTDLTWL